MGWETYRGWHLDVTLMSPDEEYADGNTPKRGEGGEHGCDSSYLTDIVDRQYTNRGTTFVC